MANQKLALQTIFSYLESFLEDKELSFMQGAGFPKRWYESVQFHKLIIISGYPSYVRSTVYEIEKEGKVFLGNYHRLYLKSLGIEL